MRRKREEKDGEEKGENDEDVCCPSFLTVLITSPQIISQYKEP